MNFDNLNSFLTFGYFLDYKNPNFKFDFSDIQRGRYESVEEAELIDIASDLWVKTISDQFMTNEQHVVPLSGGLDSRAILGALLEFTEASNISTYTFGTPGTYDYEIGTIVAKHAGTKHTSIDLTKSEYNQKELIQVSERVDFQALLFLHPPLNVIDSLFQDFNVWSGTIIDVFFGRHYHKKEADNLKDGISNSFLENIYVKSTQLTNVDSEKFHRFIDFDESIEGKMGYEHVIDILNRQLKFIAPHVLLKGFKYKTMLSKDLIDFAISINPEYLRNQILYKKMFIKKYPKLFSLPTKSNFGLPLNSPNIKVQLKRGIDYGKKLVSNHVMPFGVNRNINYIDFSSGIRERDDLKKIIYTNIIDLKNRNILDWIDIEKIWKDHINRRNDHADALLVLASLEIHLKAGKEL